MSSTENLLTISLPITSSFEGKDQLKMATRLLNEMKVGHRNYSPTACH